MRRRLEGVASVSISLTNQTTQVKFAGAQPFSPQVFEQAVGEAGAEVISFQIDACGVLEQTDGQHWLDTGADRFLLIGRELGATGQAVCVSGRLESLAMPYRLNVTDVQVSSD